MDWSCAYTFEQVNCIERPVEVACESCGKYTGMLFLLFLKLKRCYCLVKYSDENVKEYSMVQEIELVLRDALGLKLLRMRPSNFRKMVLKNIGMVVNLVSWTERRWKLE